MGLLWFFSVSSIIYLVTGTPWVAIGATAHSTYICHDDVTSGLPNDITIKGDKTRVTDRRSLLGTYDVMGRDVTSG